MKVSKAKFLAVWIVSTGAVALMTFGVAKTVGVSFTGNDSPPAQVQSALSRPSDRVTVCVDYVEGIAQNEPARDATSIEALARSKVEAATVAVMEAHPVLGKASVVDIGCPSAPYPLAAWEVKLTEPTTIPSVSQPSYYRVFVFVVPSQEALQQVLGQTGVRVMIQENVCEGPGGTPPCSEVTEGVYVTADELSDGSVSLPRLLEQGLGLASRDSGY